MVATDSAPPVVIDVRPKRLARKPALETWQADRLREERLVALAFGLALDTLGISNVRAGEILGCGESRIRDLRTRKAPLSAVHILKLPQNVRAAMDVALGEVLRAPAANDVDPSL